MLVRELRRLLEEVDGSKEVTATILTDALGREFPVNLNPNGKPLMIVEDLDHDGLAEDFEPLPEDLDFIDN